MKSNEWEGGGEEVDHSSDGASQGLSPANAPWRRANRTLATNSSTPSPSTNAPTLASKFNSPNPVLAAYVYIRRVMPCSPSECIGKNVRLKPMNINAKVQRPARSLSIRPLNFGNQW